MNQNRVDLARVRQPILYAEAMWRRQWYFGALLAALGVAIAIVNAFFPATGRALGANSPIWALYLPGGCLLLAGLLFYRWRNHVRVGDRLHISNLLSSVDIDYGLIRGLRVQPLKIAFESAGRKRYRSPVMRPYMERPALFIRLRKEDPATPYIIRKLGSRIAYEDTLALPVPDPDALSWEISARLPEKLGANLGGQRRGKRRR
jgi:hypothetical protein